MTIDVAVIGGGISGLATACELTRQGHRVVVLERQVRAGGNAVSERIGGFLMEHGPSTVTVAIPDAARLAQSAGLDDRRCDLGPGVRYRYLVGAGRLHRISTHPLGFLTSGYLSPLARLRLIAEMTVPRGSAIAEETVAGFWSRRFGREFAERVIDPMVGGMFAANAREVSMNAVFPALVEMERQHGSIIRGLTARRRAGGRMPARRLYSWRDGIGSLPLALAEGLGPALRTGVAVRRIGRAPGGFRIDAGAAGTIAARAVVVATQPHVAAGLLEAADPAAAEAAASIGAPPLAVVFLGYKRRRVAHPLDGLGYLAPSAEGRALTGVLFCSTMFPGRAPEGHVALAAYLGGARSPDLARLAPAELIDLARCEFGDLLGARGAPTIARVRQWPRGLPQYRLGHGDLVATFNTTARRCPGLFLTGNYLTGVSVGNCVAEATRTSALVDRYLADVACRGSQVAEAGPVPMRLDYTCSQPAARSF
jgi:oxygen-dependent protoporphyrinogen oxidase